MKKKYYLVWYKSSGVKFRIKRQINNLSKNTLTWYTSHILGLKYEMIQITCTPSLSSRGA